MTRQSDSYRFFENESANEITLIFLKKLDGS